MCSFSRLGSDHLLLLLSCCECACGLDDLLGLVDLLSQLSDSLALGLEQLMPLGPCCGVLAKCGELALSVALLALLVEPVLAEGFDALQVKLV